MNIRKNGIRIGMVAGIGLTWMLLAQPGYGASVSAGASAGAGVSSAMEKLTSTEELLDQAIEKQLQRKPMEAIELYRKVVEQDRDDIEHSSSALVCMVECFQLLKGDSHAEKLYAELMKKYLTTPPPLDGKSTLNLDQAKEDLLWKPWGAPTNQSKAAFIMATYTNALALYAKDNTTQGKEAYSNLLTAVTNLNAACLNVTESYTQGVTVGRSVFKIDDIEKKRGADGQALFSLSLAFAQESGRLMLPHGLEERNFRISGFCAIGDDGIEYRDVSPYADFSFCTAQPQIRCPKSVSRLKSVSGHLQLVKTKSVDSAELVLIPGTSKTIGGITFTLASVAVKTNTTSKMEDATTSVKAEIEVSGDARFPKGLLEEWSKAIQKCHGQYLFAEWPKVRLDTGIAPGCSFSQSGGVMINNDHNHIDIHFSYSSIAGQPVSIVFKMSSEVSCKDYPFEFKNVELP